MGLESFLQQGARSMAAAGKVVLQPASRSVRQGETSLEKLVAETTAKDCFAKGAALDKQEAASSGIKLVKASTPVPNPAKPGQSLANIPGGLTFRPVGEFPHTSPISGKSEPYFLAISQPDASGLQHYKIQKIDEYGYLDNVDTTTFRTVADPDLVPYQRYPLNKGPAIDMEFSPEYDRHNLLDHLIELAAHEGRSRGYKKPLISTMALTPQDFQAFYQRGFRPAKPHTDFKTAAEIDKINQINQIIESGDLQALNQFDQLPYIPMYLDMEQTAKRLEPPNINFSTEVRQKLYTGELNPRVMLPTQLHKLPKDQYNLLVIDDFVDEAAIAAKGKTMSHGETASLVAEKMAEGQPLKVTGLNVDTISHAGNQREIKLESLDAVLQQVIEQVEQGAPVHGINLSLGIELNLATLAQKLHKSPAELLAEPQLIWDDINASTDSQEKLLISVQNKLKTLSQRGIDLHGAAGNQGQGHVNGLLIDEIHGVAAKGLNNELTKYTATGLADSVNLGNYPVEAVQNGPHLQTIIKTPNGDIVVPPNVLLDKSIISQQPGDMITGTSFATPAEAAIRAVQRIKENPQSVFGQYVTMAPGKFPLIPTRVAPSQFPGYIAPSTARP